MRESMSVHAAIAGVFFAFGVGIGLWGGASGGILARSGVDAGAFGVILTVYTAVYLVAMSAARSPIGLPCAESWRSARSFSAQRSARCSTPGPASQSLAGSSSPVFSAAAST
jgi:hypothetical protein